MAPEIGCGLLSVFEPSSKETVACFESGLPGRPRHATVFSIVNAIF